MTTSIFIRTYHKDIAWLNYALKSIHKYCSGFCEIVICIPKSQRALLNHLTAEKVVVCPDYTNDYLGQQVSKMLAYKYCSGDMIFYTDSDCIFLKPTKPEDFLINGLPFILKTPYEKVGDAICWKKPTELALRYPIGYEYMRRLPLMYYSNTLRNINKYLLGSQDYILKQEMFSEFNIIGAFAEKFETNSYAFLDTDTCELPPLHLKQFFSHDGVERFEEEIKAML